MDKPTIDNSFKPPMIPKSKWVNWEHGAVLIRRLQEAGYTILKTIETDTATYVEWIWITQDSTSKFYSY